MRPRRTLIGCCITFAACLIAGCAKPADPDRPDVDYLYKTPPTTSLSCGVDSLYICAHSTGHRSLRLAELERQLPPGPRGVSLDALVEVANANGLEVAVYDMPAEGVGRLPLPAICHVNDTHYIAVLSVKAGRVVAFDNAVGLFDCSQVKFDAAYHQQGPVVAFGPHRALSWEWILPAMGGVGCLLFGIVAIWPRRITLSATKVGIEESS